ncbi:MAG: hypothetical protein GY749_00070 [Desulfobacteraceae bacterium]|nr:hypothetical protein [Desulfobacteraceae bacterium]
MKLAKKILKTLVLVVVVLIVGGLSFFTYWNVMYHDGKSEWQKEADIIVKPIDDVQPKGPLGILAYNIGFAVGPYQESLGVHKELSVLQRNLDAIVQTVNETHADILLLQEVDLHSTRTHELNQLAYLQDKLHWKYAAQAVDWSKYVPSKGLGKIHKCVAILSKYPIVKHEVKRFTFKPRLVNRIVNFFYHPFLWQSPTQYVQIAYNNTQLHIFNVHFSVFGPENRLLQLQDLVSWITTLQSKDNVIIGGDFNFHAKIVRWKYEAKGGETETPVLFQPVWHSLPNMQEVFLDANSTSEQIHQQITYPELKKRYDFIFFSDNFEPGEGKIIDSISSSDHLPVFVQLSLPQK